MKYAKWILLGVIVFIVGAWVYNLVAAETTIRNIYNQKITERTAFYDKLWKTISQKGQVAAKNDTSFHRNIVAIMNAREDGANVFMKWVQESNPNANFNEVSALYQDLSRTIEAEREGFFDRELMLQDVKLQHDNLIKEPSHRFVFWIFGIKELDYKPITSDRTDDVMKTGKDNNVSVF